MHYVYILRLENHHLYVGSTNDLSRRLAEHRNGCGCKTTRPERSRMGTSDSLLVELLYSEKLPDLAAALNRERQLKGWSRAKKLALIHGDLTQLKGLARCHSPRNLIRRIKSSCGHPGPALSERQ